MAVPGPGMAHADVDPESGARRAALVRSRHNRGATRRRRCRPFTIRDAIILVGASAAELALARRIFGDAQVMPRSPMRVARPIACFLLAWTSLSSRYGCGGRPPLRQRWANCDGKSRSARPSISPFGTSCCHVHTWIHGRYPSRSHSVVPDRGADASDYDWRPLTGLEDLTDQTSRFFADRHGVRRREEPGDEESGRGGQPADERGMQRAAAGRVPVNRPLM